MDPARTPVILTYHSIANGDSPLEVAPELFAAQMEWLKANARVVLLNEVVTALARSVPLPAKTVVLTFDDGFRDFYEVAAPVLLRLELPSIVFVTTSYVGRTNSWPGQPSWVTPQPLMSWDQVKELAGQGIRFGAHSVSHPVLTGLSSAAVEREAGDSQSEIQSRTGHATEFFCYPYGRWNASVREIVQRTYLGACSTGAGVVESNADPFALPRVDAHYVRNARWFRALFTQRFRAYVAARRLVRRLRGEPEGSYARI